MNVKISKLHVSDFTDLYTEMRTRLLVKICYFDAFSGISGDMTVGALIDAGADWHTLEHALKSLNLDAQFRLEKTKRKDIAASKFYVDFNEQKKHRHLPHIEKIVTGANLPERAARDAIAVFRKLGEAEAKTHDLPIEKVHFHEVGAVDSVSDIVGACVALDLLGVDEVYSSRINVGSGTVNTEHGVLPVPAPATAELLKDKPVYSAGPEAELTTPTGAAIVAALAKHVGSFPPVKLLAQGFGAGDKDFPTQANVLRAIIGERSGASEHTSVAVIEANVDDSTPQVLGFAMERLLESGALDVTLAPVFMKKNRPATQVTVIAPPALTDNLAHILFQETTTLGVRVYHAERRVIERAVSRVETQYGSIQIKHTVNGTFSPEYDDCRQAARTHNVALRTVIAEAARVFRDSHS